MKTLFYTLSTAIWFALAIYETIHDLSGLQWGALAAKSNWVGMLYVPLWVACALAVWSELRYRTPLLTFGALTPLIHGVIILAVGDGNGAYFFFSTPILATLLVNAERQRTAEQDKSMSELHALPRFSEDSL